MDQTSKESAPDAEKMPERFLEWIYFFEDGGEFPNEEVKKAYEDYKFWDKDVALRYTEQGWINLCGAKMLLRKLLKI